MLKTRVITAAVLLGILLPILFFLPPVAWALASLLFVAAGAWEWARLARARAPLLSAGFLLVFGLLWLVMRDYGYWSPQASRVVFSVATAFWISLAPLWMYQKRSTQVFRHWTLFLLLAAWLALVEARQGGIGFMLSILVLVWLADIGAYIAGKTLGKHKLAPNISPGKTWEGVAGGLAASVAAGLAAAVLGSSNYFAILAHRFNFAALIVAMMVLVGISIVGDLFESFLKRQAGVKDSSHLLPGHGGVLDRIDALLPVLPMAMLFYQWSHV